MTRSWWPSLTLLALLAGSCGGQPVAPTAPPASRLGDASPAVPLPSPASRAGRFAVASPAFASGSSIPARFTSDGEDVSPPLEIVGTPPGTISLALVVDDPDAPVGTWVHWLVWNIPPDTTVIAAGTVPPGAVVGRNSWGRSAYGGPSPPSGTHRYFFTLYALDTTLRLSTDADRARLDRAMAGHVRVKAELLGLYSRASRE